MHVDYVLKVLGRKSSHQSIRTRARFDYRSLHFGSTCGQVRFDLSFVVFLHSLPPLSFPFLFIKRRGFSLLSHFSYSLISGVDTENVNLKVLLLLSLSISHSIFFFLFLLRFLFLNLSFGEITSPNFFFQFISKKDNNYTKYALIKSSN